MSEPTVQVPVSLIERARDALRSAHPDRWAVYEELHALLSQPTPSAEPEESGVCHCGTPMSDHSAWDNHNPVDMSYPTSESKFREQYVHVPEEWHPPRIEDMAPGTTFTARFVNGSVDRRFERTKMVAPVRLLPSQRTYWIPDIDPSTIRDITPPA